MVGERCLFVVPLVGRPYHRGRGSKGRSRKRSFGDDGAIAGANGKEQSPASITAPLPAIPSYTRRPLLHLNLPHHSTGRLHFLDKQLHPVNRPSAPRRIATSLRRRRSRSFHRHKILSIGAILYKSTLAARHHSALPAEWPFSPHLRPQPLTSISQTFINPRSRRNRSTTPLPPPWIKKSPSLRRCCPLFLAAF